MKFLKTHTGAMVVLAVVIVLSVLLGSHRSLVQAREKVEAQFAPIAGDLQDCLDITANLLTVAGRYLDEGELGELTDSRAALAESGGITEAHAAYERLLGDAETVFLKLEDCVLSGRDADYVKGFRTDLAASRTHRPGRLQRRRRPLQRAGAGGLPRQSAGDAHLCAPGGDLPMRGARGMRRQLAAALLGRGSPDGGGPGRGGAHRRPLCGGRGGRAQQRDRAVHH